MAVRSIKFIRERWLFLLLLLPIVEPLKYSTAFRMTQLNPSVLYSVVSHGILDKSEQQYYDMLNRNLGRLQFDPY